MEIQSLKFNLSPEELKQLATNLTRLASYPNTGVEPIDFYTIEFPAICSLQLPETLTIETTSEEEPATTEEGTEE